MIKKILVVAAFSMFSVVLSSCGAKQNTQAEQQVAELQKQIADLQKQVNQQSQQQPKTNNQVTQTPPIQQSTQPVNQNIQNGAGQTQDISADQAKSIAVSHAGFDMANVTFVKQNYDFDDGIAKWEIEFVVNANEYEYDINASNGAIVKYKVESIYND